MQILCGVDEQVQEIDVFINKRGALGPLFDRVFLYQVIRFYQDFLLSSAFVPTLRTCLPL